ncbi:(Fe-S)-binding protein [Corynebacterium aquilae]|uniref:(Fe-S)-binding protein n=1 Tax=Corynebacterium aquilae TaxID=203263 RepID=UPI000A008BFA|nr:(Fe-S)-binding protein [Corynebacterium aquilae]
MLDSLIASCPTITAQTMTLGLLGVLLSLPAWGYFLTGAVKLFRFVKAGRPDSFTRTDQLPTRLATLLKEVVFHTELARKPFVAAAHWLVMVGFLLGSIVWFEAYIQTFNPQGSWPIIGDTHAYHLVDELLGLGTVIGVLFLIGVRLSTRGSERNRFYGSNATAAHFVEAVVLLEGLGMLMVKAGRIATWPLLFGNPHTDFFTIQLAKLLPANATMVSVFALIKLLTGMIWLFIVGQQLRWGVAWHRFLAFFNIFLQRNPDGAPALGKLATPDLEADGPVGVGRVGDASWKMLLDSATCTECGRCQDVCPAWNTNKPLSPKKLIMAERDAALSGESAFTLVGNSIHPDELWSCTNCGACVEQCPVDIEHIDHVAALRRYQVLEEADFPQELTGLFKNLENKGNPWGRNASERRTWIDKARDRGLQVPVIGDDATMDNIEYLYWVGCAGVYDDAAQQTTIAVVELLNTAGVPFAVLGDGETCTGDPARRAGNEFLFQMLAEQNVETLNEAFDGVPRGQRKIITTCAHCFNTIRNEYPDFDGHFEVFHHTQLLNRLVREGRLTPVPRTDANRRPITYHDPCFLGRHNKVFDPPRELLGEVGPLNEAPRNKDNAMCCGAGGARMFMEEKLGTRIADARAAELRDTGAGTVAVGCPFCHTMLTGGMKATGSTNDAVDIKDVAVLMRDAVTVDGKLPKPLPLKPLQPLKREPKKADTKTAQASEPTQTPAVTSTQVSAPAAPATATTPTPPAAATPPAPGMKAPGVSTPAASAPAPGASAPVAPQAPGAAAPQAPAAPVASAPAAPQAPGAVPPAPAAPSAPQATAPAAVPPAPSAPRPPSAVAPQAPVAPGASAPTAPQAPGAAAPQAPNTAAPAPAAPTAPGAAVAPGAVPPAPTAPAAPGGSAPAAPQAPGAVPPAPAAPNAPQAATPTAVPPAPSAPRPPSAVAPQVPAAPGASAPTAPQAPGAVPPAPAAPNAPQAAAPTAVPPAPSAPRPPSAAAPAAPQAPSAAAPAPDAPTAPGAVVAPGAVPPAPAAPAAPGAVVAPGAVPPAPVAPKPSSAATPPAKRDSTTSPEDTHPSRGEEE